MRQAKTCLNFLYPNCSLQHISYKNKVMNKVKISNTDLEIAPLNFGGNVFGWTLNEEQSFGILDAFLLIRAIIL